MQQKSLNETKIILLPQTQEITHDKNSVVNHLFPRARPLLRYPLNSPTIPSHSFLMGAKNNSVDEWTLTLGRQTCLLRSQVGQARKNRQLHFMPEPQLPLGIRGIKCLFAHFRRSYQKRYTNIRVSNRDRIAVKVTNLGKGTAETDVRRRDDAVSRLPLEFSSFQSSEQISCGEYSII